MSRAARSGGGGSGGGGGAGGQQQQQAEKRRQDRMAKRSRAEASDEDEEEAGEEGEAQQPQRQRQRQAAGDEAETETETSGAAAASSDAIAAPAAAAAAGGSEGTADSASGQQEEGEGGSESGETSVAAPVDSSGLTLAPCARHGGVQLGVEQILAQRAHRGRKQYRVKWAGVDGCTWEWARTVSHCATALAAFRAAHPPKAPKDKAAATAAAAAARARRAAERALQEAQAGSDSEADAEGDQQTTTPATASARSNDAAATAATAAGSSAPSAPAASGSGGSGRPRGHARHAIASLSRSSQQPGASGEDHSMQPGAAGGEGGAYGARMQLDEQKSEKLEQPGESFVFSAGASPAQSAPGSPFGRAAAAAQTAPEVVDLSRDSYSCYWRQQAEAMSKLSALAQAQAQGQAPGSEAVAAHMLLGVPPEPLLHASRSGVSPCKISVVNPLYDPSRERPIAGSKYRPIVLAEPLLPAEPTSEQQLQQQRAYVEPASVEAAAVVGDGGDCGGVAQWVCAEEDAWRRSVEQQEEWEQAQQAQLGEDGAPPDDDRPPPLPPSDTIDATMARPQLQPQTQASEGDPAATAAAALLPTLHINGTAYVYVDSLPPAPRTRMHLHVVQDDADEPMPPLPPSPTAGAPTGAALGGAEGSPAPSLPPSPLPTPPSSVLHSPESGAAVGSSAAAAARDLSPRGRRSAGPASGHTLSPPFFSATPTAATGRRGLVPTPLSTPSAVATGGVGGPRSTRSSPAASPIDMSAMESSPRASPRLSRHGSAIDLPPMHTPRTARSASSGAATRVRQDSPGQSLHSPHAHPGSFLLPQAAAAGNLSPAPPRPPVSEAEQLLMQEEAKLTKRKGHLTSVEGARLKFLLARPERAARMAGVTQQSPSPQQQQPQQQQSPAPASAPATAQSPTPATPRTRHGRTKSGDSSHSDDKSHATAGDSAAAAPTNRRERRQLARDAGTLGRGDSGESGETSGGGGGGSASGTPERLAVVGVAGVTPVPYSPAGVGRSSRSSVDLSGMAMTSKDWPSRYNKRSRNDMESHSDASGSTAAAASAAAAPASSRSHKRKSLASASSTLGRIEESQTSSESAPAAMDDVSASASVASASPRVGPQSSSSVPASPVSLSSRNASRVGTPHSHSHVESSSVSTSSHKRRLKVEPVAEEAEGEATGGDSGDPFEDDPTPLHVKATFKRTGAAAAADSSAETQGSKSGVKKQRRSPSPRTPSGGGGASSSSSSKAGPFLHGNYANYYGYRNSSNYWLDARLPLLRRDWFLDKTVLDLGCNSGLLSVLVASTYSPRSLLGIDLDAHLVDKAWAHLRQRAEWMDAQRREKEKKEKKRNKRAGGGGFGGASVAASTMRARLVVPKRSAVASLAPPPPSSSPPSPLSSSSSLPLPSGPSDSAPTLTPPLSPPPPAASFSTSFSSSSSPSLLGSAPGAPSSLFPRNVRFAVGDILSYPLAPQSFDTILCCSLTKWLHFHGGDAAVRLLFERVDAALRPGGMCVLEPQPWRSYKKKANLNDQIRHHYRSIQLRPESFPAYLAETHGWVLKHTLYTSASRHRPAEPHAQQDDDAGDSAASGVGAGAAADVLTAAAVVPEGGFQARPIYVFEKPQ